MSDVRVEIFTQHLPQLADLLGANPECCLSLAIELTQRKLIAFATLASARHKTGIDRALVVLEAVRPTIRDNPVAFGGFLSALEREEILCSVAGKMRREADRPGNVTSESTAASPALEPTPSERRESHPGNTATINVSGQVSNMVIGSRDIHANHTTLKISGSESFSAQGGFVRTPSSHPQTQDSAKEGCSDTDTRRFSEEKALQLLCCCGKCSMKEFVKSGCPSASGKVRKFPLLSLDRLSHGKRIQLITRLLAEYEEVRDKFATLVSEVRQIFKSTMNVQDLIGHLLDLKVTKFHPNLANKSVLESLETRLKECDSVPQVFIVLTEIWSWFNHSLLGRIIRVSVFAVNDDIKAKYDSYISDFLIPYLQRSAFEIPSDSFGPKDDIPGFEMFCLKIDDSLAVQIKAEQLSRIQCDIASALEIEPEALILKSLETGCFQIKFLLLSDVVNEVLPFSPARIRAFSCLELRVTRIECCEFLTSVPPIKESLQQDLVPAMATHHSPSAEGFPKYMELVPMSSTFQGQTPPAFLGQATVSAKSFAEPPQNFGDEVSAVTDPSELSLEKALRQEPDKKAQEHGCLSVEDLARFHISASQCVHFRRRAYSDSVLEVANLHVLQPHRHNHTQTEPVVLSNIDTPTELVVHRSTGAEAASASHEITAGELAQFCEDVRIEFNHICYKDGDEPEDEYFGGGDMTRKISQLQQEMGYLQDKMEKLQRMIDAGIGLDEGQPQAVKSLTYSLNDLSTVVFSTSQILASSLKKMMDLKKEMEKKLEDAVIKLEHARKETETYRRISSAKSHECELLRRQRKELQSKLPKEEIPQHTPDQIFELRQANESLERKTAELGDQVKILEKIKEEMSVEASELKQQLDTAKFELEGKKGAEAELQQRLTGIKMSLMMKQDELDEVRKVADTRGTQLENLQSEHENLKMRLEKKEGTPAKNLHLLKCRVLNKESNKLRHTIKNDFEELTFELCANDLISREDRDAKGAAMVVSKIQSGLEADEGVWEKLLTVLKYLNKDAMCGQLEQKLRLEMGEEAAGR